MTKRTSKPTNCIRRHHLWLGHTVFVVEPDREVDPLGHDGWRVVAHCSTIESARRGIEPGQRIYEWDGERWNRIARR